MDPITLLVGAGLLASGSLGGFAAGWTARGRRQRGGAASRAVCDSCDHDLGQHDPDTNACHGTIERDEYDDGVRVGKLYVQCTCRQYVGPKPIENLFAQPIALPPNLD